MYKIYSYKIKCQRNEVDTLLLIYLLGFITQKQNDLQSLHPIHSISIANVKS